MGFLVVVSTDYSIVLKRYYTRLDLPMWQGFELCSLFVVYSVVVYSSRMNRCTVWLCTG